MNPHDFHDFIASSERIIAEEYQRIQKRAIQDPGTAGDQGEENWATLLRSWLPSYFQVVTKGRILAESGYASPQMDVIVLLPSYPKILLDKKLYLAGGVAAAFECKTTLKAEHVHAAVETAAALRIKLPKREGSPYRELCSTIVYGLLAHSHSWKGQKSTPLANVEHALWEADAKHVTHPIQCLDYVTVSDLATWSTCKMTYLSPKIPGYSTNLAAVYGPNGSASTGYICHPIAKQAGIQSFSPLGELLSGLYLKLAWIFTDMRTLHAYFRSVLLQGTVEGQLRNWEISIYSDAIRDRVFNGKLSNGAPFDEWAIGFY